MIKMVQASEIFEKFEEAQRKRKEKEKESARPN